MTESGAFVQIIFIRFEPATPHWGELFTTVPPNHYRTGITCTGIKNIPEEEECHMFSISNDEKQILDTIFIILL